MQSRASQKSIADCVVHLSTFLGRPISRLALFDALPDGSKEEVNPQSALSLEIKRAVVAAEHVGLSAFFGRRTATRISEDFLPAILPMKDGSGIVLHERRANGLIVYDPKQGNGLRQVDATEVWKNWTGFILSLRYDAARHAKNSEGTAGEAGHWFWSALWSNKWAYTQVLIAAIITNILALVASLYTMVVYDRILPTGATDSLYALTIGVGLALGLDLIVKTLRAGFLDQAGQNADRVMGQRIFDHVVGMQHGARRGSVGTVAATIREFENLRDFFASATLVAMVDLPFVFIFLTAIFFLAGPLFIVPAITVPLVVCVGVAVQPALNRLSRKILSETQTKQTVLVETLIGIETIKSTGAGFKMRSRWAETMSRQSDYALRSRGVTQFAVNVTGFLQQAAQILIVVHGALLVVNGDITSGVLIASVILTGRALAPLAVISQTLTRFHQARSSYQSLDSLMKAPTERPSGQEWLARPILAGRLTFDDVSYGYPLQKTLALNGVTFDIKPGERVAIVGAIGSGKSTILRLALGLYTPKSGTVSVDRVNLAQIDPTDLRRNIGAVLQEPWLVSGTLRENICFGTPDATDDAVLEASKVSGVEEFAARHPDGYLMQLGERGEGLSGGEKQSVALARAILNEPSILLLDEPTASMDTQSESRLIHHLKSILNGRTLVLITHRQSLLELVDRVIVLDSGKVVADGPKSILRTGPSGGSI